MVEIDNEHFEKIISLTENYILNSKYYKIEEIDKLVYSRQNGIVYFFYIKENNNFILKYIGKSTGKGFKTRLRAHFFGIGKGTQSKFEKINKEKEIKDYLKNENINGFIAIFSLKVKLYIKSLCDGIS